ncbi:DUF4214 domain-containing protein [Octadecabacter sp. CECT 8868]|nr:DUF4214 domain-containing protein [Octadecabacter algicola]
MFRLYHGTLDRDPDARGFDGWSDRLEKGQYSLTEVVNGFIKSAEFNNKYGNTTNAEFVTLLYNNVLDRNPDDNGLSAWSDRLELGVERADVVRGFTQSQEYIRNSAIDCVTFMSEIYENDTLEGGGGNDTFVFSDRFGSDTITDFNKVGSDVIDLSDVSSISDWSDLKSSHLRTLNGDAAIDAGDANFILLNDVNVNDLTADDFLF